MKVVWPARFASGISTSEGYRLWEETHAGLEASPDLAGYVRNFSVASLGELGRVDGDPEYTGYSCAWFDDVAAFDRFNVFMMGRAGPAAGADLFDMDYMMSMSAVIEENIVIDGPVSPFKVAWYARFPAAVHDDPDALAAAHAHWSNEHAELGKRVPGFDRYVQNHLVAGLGLEGPAGDPPRYAGFSECWFEDEAAFEGAMASDQWAEMNVDAFATFDVMWSIDRCAIVAENVIKAHDDTRVVN